jgi:hypothetical protein
VGGAGKKRERRRVAVFDRDDGGQPIGYQPGRVASG